jgi:hypothetical protein
MSGSIEEKWNNVPPVMPADPKQGGQGRGWRGRRRVISVAFTAKSKAVLETGLTGLGLSEPQAYGTLT